MSSDKTDRTHTNRLIDATSPYLLQHAHNPVDWYPWGEEALQRAKQEDKPILLSIGYSACHWCHVMERESFEDPAIAELMNENFINIKVDREERPDLDEIYMMATVSMNRGQGGWPMTVFLTPELEPVFAGTYFPPTDMHGRPGFPTVLREVARAWREDREGLRLRAGEFAQSLRQRQSLAPPLAVGEVELRKALDAYKQDFDPRHGGFGSAPKFPQAVGLQLLLRLYRRFGDPEAVAMVRTTLDGMARGGIYDHVGGGFARYSTDSRWLVPHFEKMLYDNALLVKAYLEGFQETGEPSFRRVAAETLDYVLREMTSPEGGFYSSTDADSEGVEGKFYVWTPEAVGEVLDDEEARCFNAYYDISLAGNWEGASIPNTPRPLETVAEELGLAPAELRETLESARQKVYEARSKRVKPGLDDKILAAWNGLMIGALAEGYRVLGDVRYLEGAKRAAAFVLEELSDESGALLRSYREGRAHLTAYLEDYAYLAEGLLDLYEADGALRWLREAERILEKTLSDFLDEESGAFYNTSRLHEQLLMRYRDGADGATPAGNAVAAASLARLSYHLDRGDLRRAAVQALKAHGPMIGRFPRGFAKSLCVVDYLLEGPVELAFAGARDAADTEALRRAVASCFVPNRIVAHLDPDDDDEAAVLPLLEGKTTVDGSAALYICRDFTCEAPITDPERVPEALAPNAVATDGTRSSIALRIPGTATEAGTSRYAARRNRTGYNPLGRTGLQTSRLGFGGYRLHDGDPQHREALATALTSGINLIDTSTNYVDGASERLVGSVLHELIDSDELSRDEVIVVTKIGYAQGTAQERAREREARGDPFPELVKIDEQLWHCIHPEFLDDQLQRSLDRLELETVDVLLLHNPEYYLDHAAGTADDIEMLRDEFYRRLAAAFAFLEAQVTAGRVGCYGISSNTVTAPAQQKDAVSLTRTLEAARRAGDSDHHFRVLQLPLNLLESNAVFLRDEGSGADRTVLELAEEEGVAVLVNRPLNAFVGGKLIRLADAEAEPTNVDFQEQLARLADLEFTFQAEIASKLQAAPDSLDPAEYFKLAERFKEMRPAITGIAHWNQIEGQLSLAVMAVVSAINRQLDGELRDRWIEWRDGYLGELEELMRVLRGQAAEKTQARNASLATAIDPLLPGEWRSENLARKALWIPASTPGVSCVLNGMRRSQYVDDALAVMDWPKLEDVTEIFQEAGRPADRVSDDADA